MSTMGAIMLLHGLENRIFVHPVVDVGWFKGNTSEPNSPIRAAPKIMPEDRHIDWTTWTANDIINRQNVIGPLWSYAQGSSNLGTSPRRIIWQNGFAPVSRFDEDRDNCQDSGHPFAVRQGSKFSAVNVRTCDGKLLSILECKVEGQAPTRAAEGARRAGMLVPTQNPEKPELVPFLEVLQ